jgi:hypothetical protein
MELYYREVDELLYELSMSGGISQDDPMGWSKGWWLMLNLENNLENFFWNMCLYDLYGRNILDIGFETVFLEYGCIMLHIYRDTWDYPCSMNVYDIILVGSTSIDGWRMSPCSIAKSSISQLHIVITIVKYISPLVHYPHYVFFSP